jgi:hypothetical protein
MPRVTKWYLRVAAETDIRWPDKDTEVEFGGHKLTLSPETEKHFPTVLIEYGKSFPEDAAFRLVCEFATAVAWAQGLAAYLSQKNNSTTPRFMCGKGPRMRGHVGSAEFDYLPQPKDPKTKLALALYREAMTVNLVPYQFLSFCRIINLHAGKRTRQQIDWMNAELKLVADAGVLKLVADLKAKGHADIGDYLYRQGRCAAAHASLTEITINPDDPADSMRLHQDLPIVQELAHRIIEHHLGVPSYRSSASKRPVRRHKSR